METRMAAEERERIRGTLSKSRLAPLADVRMIGGSFGNSELLIAKPRTVQQEVARRCCVTWELEFPCP